MMGPNCPLLDLSKLWRQSLSNAPCLDQSDKLYSIKNDNKRNSLINVEFKGCFRGSSRAVCTVTTLGTGRFMVRITGGARQARSTHGVEEYAYKVLVGKLEGKIPLGRVRCRCIIRKWNGDKDCTDLARDRDRRKALVNAVMNLRVP